MENGPWPVAKGKFICLAFIVSYEAFLKFRGLPDIEFIGCLGSQYVNEGGHNKKGATLATPFCSPSWTRTKDPLINSQML